MNTLVLFDFDKTIINKDTGFYFIRFALKRNVLRFLLALILSPFILLLILSNKTRFTGNSIYLWISTVGLSPCKIDKLRNRFIHCYLNSPEVFIYKDALIKINSHADKDHQILIISGASHWMVEQIIALRKFPNVNILGSSEQRFLGGMKSDFHCFGQNKVKALNKFLNINSYTKVIGYSDSSSDIPILSICQDRYIINPTKRSLIRFEKVFKANMSVLNWI